MDADSGDLYAYSPPKRAWEPLLNMGVYRIPSSGAPAPPQRQYPRENHTRREVDVDGTLARVRTCHLQHPYLSGLPSQSFQIKPTPEWHLHDSHTVLADSPRGAVLLAPPHSLLLASRLDSPDCRVIFANFVGVVVGRLSASRSRRIDLSLLGYLFGEDGVSGGTYDGHTAATARAPPLSRRPVPTSLRAGPVCVAPPAVGLFLHTPRGVDYLALTSPRQRSTLGRTPLVVVAHSHTGRGRGGCGHGRGGGEHGNRFIHSGGGERVTGAGEGDGPL
ncbi:hypothetical protein B484DRAFT_417983 [Ochromonadaceae sp. CCMP2298]|nr:hypothetical protein B484DRAFT_417983 [Ochromonadaceae sp. CCMP2298]